MRAQGSNGARPTGLSDRDVWRLSQHTDASRDEAGYLMDLAAFADSRLDPDEAARVEALIVGDADADADVAATRVLAGTAIAAADPAIIARAEALVDEGSAEAVLIAFPAPRPASRPWYSAASWSGLAAAMVMAGWLGFDLGSGLSTSPILGGSTVDLTANELFDAAPLMVRDLTESSRI
jgi:anti-sigma factor RsiW